MKRDDIDEIGVVFGKDLIEVLRDYRTLIAMILMPVIIYPALLVLPSSIAHHLKSDMKGKRYNVCLIGDYTTAIESFRQSKTINLISVYKQADPDKLLAGKAADIVVSFPQRFGEMIEGKWTGIPKVTIYYDARRDKNLIALAEVRMALNQLRAGYVQKRLDTLGIAMPQKYALDFSELKISRAESLASEPVRNLLPFLLFTMLTVSIIYPALDVITGERERNTLPLLLMSPTERRNIMFGKFLVVFAIGTAALIIGLSSIYLFVQIGGNRADDLLQLKFPLHAMGMCVLVSVPLVVTLSALSIVLASWCKSFQQGQGYFVPFLLLSMGASSVCSLPELKLSSGVAFVPVVNTALALKEVLTGHIDLLWLSISTIVATGFAVYVTYLSSRILDSERLLYGVADSRARRRISGNYTPEVAGLVFVTFLLMFYVGQTLQGLDVIVGSLLTMVLVILLPAVLLLRHLKLPMMSTMSIVKPRPLALIGAVLVTPICIVLSHLVYQLQNCIVPAPEAYTRIFTRLIIENDKPLWLCLIGIAVAPGICEELLFRGTILGLLRPKLKPVVLCLTVGLLFGMFHMSLFRIAPTAVLGVVLTVLTMWTGSIFPAILVHILNNSAAIIMGKHHLDETFMSYWPAHLLLGVVGVLVLTRARSEKQDRKTEIPGI